MLNTTLSLYVYSVQHTNRSAPVRCEGWEMMQYILAEKVQEDPSDRAGDGLLCGNQPFGIKSALFKAQL